jgi:prolycopene isomerase
MPPPPLAAPPRLTLPVPATALASSSTPARASRLRAAGSRSPRGVRRRAVSPEKPPSSAEEEEEAGAGGDDRAYDAVVIGSGIGGLVAATQLAAKGVRVLVLVLEKYLIPRGSSGYYRRDGFTFDVGSSVMFGFSDKVGGPVLMLMLAVFVLELRRVSPQLSRLIAVCREECVD